MSPVGASMYCSPHPAALHIAPAVRLQSFASMILRGELYHGEDMKDKKVAILSAYLSILLRLHFNSVVLFIFLRQDESLDSPTSLESA
jgi:hypothetical protein